MSDQIDELSKNMIEGIEKSYQEFLAGMELSDTKMNRARFYKMFKEVFQEEPDFLDGIDPGIQLILLEHLGRMSVMFQEAAEKDAFENVANIINKPIFPSVN